MQYDNDLFLDDQLECSPVVEQEGPHGSVSSRWVCEGDERECRACSGS